MIQQSHFWVFFFKENKKTNWKRYLRSHVHCSIIDKSQDRETSYVSTDGWMDKQMHTMEYYSAIKRGTLPFDTSQMDLEGTS